MFPSSSLSPGSSMDVERMCFKRDLIRDGYSGHRYLWASQASLKDLLNHAKASLGVARVLSQLLFMLNADKELDHEALLHTAISCVDDEVLAKMLSPLAQDKYLLDYSIAIKEEYLSSQQELKEEAEAQAAQMLKFERERYDRLADMEQMLVPEIFDRLYIESWYYTEEDEALLHLKLDHFLSMCGIIKEDSTLDGVLERLDLPEDFASIPVALVKMAIQRRIYRLKMLASIDPYKKFLREVTSKIVGEGGQSMNQIKFFLTFLDHKPSHFLEGRDEDPFLDELRSLAEKYSFGDCGYILEGSLDHCRTILSTCSSAGGIDQALEKFVEELKRGVESLWFDNQVRFSPIYTAALRKLQLEMEPRGESLIQQLYVHRFLRFLGHKVEEEVEEDEDEEVAEVLPISSSFVFSLEDFTWVRNAVFDALHIDTKMGHANSTKISGWESAWEDIDCIWKRVDLLYEELLVKISSSCLFFFEILRGMQVPQLTDIFEKISHGKDVEMKFENVDKKLKEMGLVDIVLNNLEKFKANAPANLWSADKSNISDSWQAIDLNSNRNSAVELIDFAEAFGSATKHMKGRKNTARIVSQFKDQSRVDYVKETLQGYQDSYRRERRLGEDTDRMNEQKKAASDILSDLCYVKTVHDLMEDSAKGKLVLKDKPGAYGCGTVEWWNYRRLEQAKLEQDTSIYSYIEPTEV